MTWLIHLANSLNHVLLFILVLTRVSGLMIGAPVLGGLEVPMQVRALLGITIALLVVPLQLGLGNLAPQTPLDLLLLVASELLVGLLLGLGVTIILGGLQLAGHIIGLLGGMSLSEIYNPAVDTNLPLVSQFLYSFGLAIFVLIGGHRLLLSGLLETFATVPPGGATLSLPVIETLSTLVTQSFALGVRGAAPATVALLLATLVLGLLSRTLPQLNVMSMGFGFNALATLSTLWISLGTMVYLLHEHFQPAIELVLGGIEGGG